MLASNILELLCFVVLRWYLPRLNRKKEAAARQDATPAENETTFSDMTDKQNIK